MAAGLDVELPAVPGADNVALLREPQPLAGLVGRQFLLDARNHLALTNRAAVVRAMVLVGEQLVALPEDAEFEAVDLQHAVVAFRELAEFAHHDLAHRFTPSTLLLPVIRVARGDT